MSERLQAYPHSFSSHCALISLGDVWSVALWIFADPFQQRFSSSHPHISSCRPAQDRPLLLFGCFMGQKKAHKTWVLWCIPNLALRRGRTLHYALVKSMRWRWELMFGCSHWASEINSIGDHPFSGAQWAVTPHDNVILKRKKEENHGLFPPVTWTLLELWKDLKEQAITHCSERFGWNQMRIPSAYRSHVVITSSRWSFRKIRSF